jgi:D-alanyl-lipoteichoic acid acyltransferase DltB (MBOAT superfamily)
MSNVPVLILTLLAYILCARFSLLLPALHLKLKLFAFVNIATFIWLSLLGGFDPYIDATILSLGSEAIIRHIVLVGFYVLIIIGAFFMMKRFSKSKGWLPWLAFFYPIIVLILMRYAPLPWDSLFARLDFPPWILATTIIGLSYMAFRLSYLVLEVRNDVVAMPTLSEYLGFAFFLPTILVGPINPFSTHQISIKSIDKTSPLVGRCLLRIVVGATKFFFLGNLANQLTYSSIFLDGKPHGIFDLFVTVIFYYLFLYCNFSGFCDIAIGVAGLIGIRVRENFDNPFIAKNVKEFWNRWHITLSGYTKDVIFAPASKALIKKLGPRYTNFSIALSILLVFFVVGVWHGVGVRFAVFGLIHAVGVIANHYYTIWMKRRLGRDGYKAYNENPLVNALAMVLTFGYVALSFSVFANDYYMMRVIGHALRTFYF